MELFHPLAAHKFLRIIHFLACQTEALWVIQGCGVYKIIFIEYSIAVRNDELAHPAA